MTPINKEQLRAIIYFEWRKGTSTRSAANNIKTAFGEELVSHATVSDWYRRFENGETSFKDRPRPGRPSMINDAELVRHIKERPDVSTRDLSVLMNCHHSTVLDHLRALGYRKVSARWIAHPLTEVVRGARLTACQSLLLRPHRKGFLANLVIGDETWIKYDNTTHKAVLFPYGEYPEPVPKPDSHEQRILLSCWWDSEGMIYNEMLDDNKGITASIHNRQLMKLAQFTNVEELKIAVADFFDAQKPEFWSNGIAALPSRWQQVIDNDGEHIEN
ncbi:hypothetical protein FO519_005563 [Halicephalobus sp. NKZ332]|nr:hypothetical protein FO519_005563 [Halicephalobus sp. NKZ332]